MSNLEIKGNILEMVANIDDLESLKELKKLVADFIGNRLKESDYWDELSETEKNELEQAIMESEDESNHVAHEEVMKTYKKWLDK